MLFLGYYIVSFSPNIDQNRKIHDLTSMYTNIIAPWIPVTKFDKPVVAQTPTYFVKLTMKKQGLEHDKYLLACSLFKALILCSVAKIP